MFSHVVANGIGKGEATVWFSGDAVFTHAHEMQSALSAALETCDHLTIDVGSVSALDGTFRVLLCSLHRRSELANKTLTVQGALPGQQNYKSLHARVQGCLFKGANQCCTLWGLAVRCEAKGPRTS